MASEPLKRSFKIFLLILLVCAIGLKIWQWAYWPTAVINLAGENIRVYVAQTPQRQHRGLGGRMALPEGDGMLFIFGESLKYGMVMRDMEFPIDIVWLEKGEVVDIAPNVPVEKDVAEDRLRVYRPRKASNSVLELPAGWSERHGLKIGDKLTIVKE